MCTVFRGRNLIGRNLISNTKMIHQRNTESIVSNEICHSGILQKTIPKDPDMPPERDFLYIPILKDGIGTLDPILVRGLDS